MEMLCKRISSLCGQYRINMSGLVMCMQDTIFPDKMEGVNHIKWTCFLNIANTK